MPSNTSFAPPEIMPPPMPPAAKVIVFVFSAFMTLALIGFVGIILVEIIADMAGHSLSFVERDSTDGAPFPIEQDTEWRVTSPFGLITPRHQTQMRGPEVVVIYTAREASTTMPDLRINDTLHPWEMQYGDNTWFTRLQLPAGLHHLQAGEAEADFFVVAPDSTQFSLELWLWNRPHRETNRVDRCADCHEMPDRATSPLAVGRDRAIGPWRGASSCFSCHDREEHEAIHRMLLPMNDRSLRCVRCHTIH